jgi:hypothetical protein
VCATFTSTSFSRPEERRRNLRLRVSSLIYAQLGSDNGGVVVNLGLDGILFQAAHKLRTSQNSTITLKLRGAGLNAEIAGKVVWVGATQKAAGVSFKSLPTNVKQSIADWIDRESGPSESDAPNQRRPQKSISEIADMAVPHKRTITRSLSAALALSRATSADDAAATLPERVSDSNRGNSAESSTVILPLAPSFEIFPAKEHLCTATDAPLNGFEGDDVLDSKPADENLAAKTLVEGSTEKDELSDDNAVLGLPPLNVLKQALVQALKEQEILIPPKALEKSSEAPPRPSAEIKPPEKIQKIIARPAAPAVPPSTIPKRTPVWQSAKKRIPPEILAAWNRLNQKQRQLLTHAGTVCLGLAIGLLLILLVTHIHGSSDRTIKNAAQRQSALPPDSSVDETGTANQFPKQGPPLPPLNRPKPSEPSVFSKIANSIFGTGSDASPKINDYQMGLAVWTSQSSGYYYCSDDPYVKSVQSGVPMLQGDALQAGYRPRLGQFCN